MLSLDVIWTDPDLVECRVRAASESFVAAADIYFTVDSLLKFADAVGGFPTSAKDHREFASENSPSVGNSFRLLLDCVDAAAHAIATVELSDREDSRQSAVVRFPVSASDIDQFEIALRTISATEKGNATLGSAAAVSA
jgi:hypothetical protein